MQISGSLLTNIPEGLEAELFESLLNVANVRIERIVSTGQATPPGEWYDQAWDEWVVLIAGAAEVLLENEEMPRSLSAGDYLFLTAHLRHRVTWTSPDRPTVWLSVHIALPENG